MLRTLLICGLVAGLCGGLVAAGFATVAAEPAIDAAIVYEQSQSTPGHDGNASAPVSRELQKSVGLFGASMIYGLSLGGIFALVFAFAYGRVARATPRRTAWWLAAAGFVVVHLVPFVKYPANPPAVGEAETIGRRTALYAVMLAISVVSAVAAARLRPALARRTSGESATALATGVFVGLVVAAGLALPAGAPVPVGFPAETLWRFREGSLGTQLVLWAVIGLVFAHAAQRVMNAQPLFPRRGSRSGVAPAGD